MTKELAEFFQNVMENQDESCEIRDSYSGRGMYGDTTYGIVISSELLLIQCLLDHFKGMYDKDDFDPDLIPEFDSLRHDNIAMDVIIY